MRCALPRQDGSTPCWCLRALQNMDRLWLLGITLVLTMASGERLLEPGARLKTVKPKSQADRPTEYWSPNYLGRVFRAETENGDPGNHQRPHWRKGHL